MYQHDFLKQFPTIQHVFFTRQNGFSNGIYKSLNLGRGSNDSLENIEKNYAFIHQKMGTDRLISLNQIHSNHVISVTDANNWQTYCLQKGDGLVTNQPNIVLGVLTADCGPLLLADPHHHVIGAAHLGRKGALTDLLENTVAAMVNLGAQRSHIHAVLGPTISKKNYEMGQDIFDLMNINHKNYIQHLYKLDQTNKYLLDMHGLIQEICQKAHIQFQNLNLCTYDHPDLFYSYRRSTHKQEKDYGRLISTIKMVN